MAAIDAQESEICAKCGGAFNGKHRGKVRKLGARTRYNSRQHGDVNGDAPFLAGERCAGWRAVSRDQNGAMSLVWKRKK